MAYRQAYSKTKTGVIEVKDIPAASVMEASGVSGSSYFKDRGGSSPFMKLFRYIQSNNIPMTTPVEVNPDANNMRFYSDSNSRQMSETTEVAVKQLPARTVLSIGITGSYSQENFDKAQKKLLDFLSKNSQYEVIEEAYAVYWDGPYKPFFLKHAEVHIPILKK